MREGNSTLRLAQHTHTHNSTSNDKRQRNHIGALRRQADTFENMKNENLFWRFLFWVFNLGPFFRRFRTVNRHSLSTPYQKEFFSGGYVKPGHCTAVSYESMRFVLLSARVYLRIQRWSLIWNQTLVSIESVLWRDEPLLLLAISHSYWRLPLRVRLNETVKRP